MHNLPTFRLIHKAEAQDHARLICKRKGLRKNTREYKKQFDLGIYQYVKEAVGSLYPSGELTAQNPTRRKMSSSEQAKKSHKVMSKLTDSQYKTFLKSKDAGKIISRVEHHKEWNDIYVRHLKRGKEVPSELEAKNMLKIEKYLMNDLARGKSVKSKVRIVLNYLKKDYGSVLELMDKQLSVLAKRKYNV